MILSTDPASIIRFTVKASNMEHEGLNWSYSRSSVALWMALQSIKLYKASIHFEWNYYVLHVFIEIYSAVKNKK